MTSRVNKENFRIPTHMHCASNKAPQCVWEHPITRAQCETGHEEPVTPVDVAARAVSFEHADSWLPSVSGSTSDIEAAMFGSLSETPETGLLMSVWLITCTCSYMCCEGLPVQPLGVHCQPLRVLRRG
jgi:hypothetical protein